MADISLELQGLELDEDNVTTASTETTKSKRLRCTYCRFCGHIKIDCLKYSEGQGENKVYSKIPRPILDFHIDGVHKTAIVSTGTTHCIASTSLQKFLKKKGYVPKLSRASVNYFGSGESKEYDVEVFYVPIIIKERSFVATFVVPPITTPVQNVLGMHFIAKVLWFSKGPGRFLWHFHDKPNKLYNFSNSKKVKALYDKYTIYGVYITFL